MRGLDAGEIMEPMDIPEEHVGGLGYSERLSDGSWRFVFFGERRGQRIATLAIHVSEERAMEGLRQTAHAFGYVLVPMATH